MTHATNTSGKEKKKRADVEKHMLNFSCPASKKMNEFAKRRASRHSGEKKKHQKRMIHSHSVSTHTHTHIHNSDSQRDDSF